MPVFEASVIIENKQGMNDPEGQTILDDLVLKSYKSVSRIKTAKMLKFTIHEETAEAARLKIAEICDELRIYNPVSSNIRIKVGPADS